MPVWCAEAYVQGWVQLGAGILSAEGDHFDVIKWSSFLRSIRNHRLEEAIEIVQQLGAQWEPGQQEIVQTALLDLKAKLQGKVVTSHLQMVPYSRTAGAGGTPPSDGCTINLQVPCCIKAAGRNRT